MIQKYKNCQNSGLIEFVSMLNNMPNTEIALKLILLILHWIPIITFVILGALDNYNTSNSVSIWICGMIFITCYSLVIIRNGMIYEYYGKRKLCCFIIGYPILLFIVCLYLTSK